MSDWLASHRRFVVVFLLIATIAGAAAALRLPVGLFPQVNFPRIAVSADAGDRDVELMVTQVTMPLEEAVRAVPGVTSVRSRSSRGSAELSIDFEWGHDMVTALLQVQTALAETATHLPAGSAVSARRLDPTVFPILGYSLTSDTRAANELGDIATFQVRPVLLRVGGVSSVGVQGAPIEEFRVSIDPELLAARGLTFADVNAALAGANTLESLGRVEDRGKLLLILSTNSTRSIGEIESTILRGGSNGITRLLEVAHVSLSRSPQWTRVTADGHDAVLIQVYQQVGGNTVRIAADAAHELETLRATLPADVKLATWYDQSHLVSASAHSLRDAVLIGTVLAALVLLVFLRSVTVTLLAAVVVPSVLAASCLLLLVLGQSLNIMTLGGMAAAVGLIIDDVIVMVEHIEYRLRTGSKGIGEPRHPALGAARDFTRPLLGASLATIIIHVPPAFLSGVTGEFFKALSLTMAVSLIVSFFVAWLVVPVFAEAVRLGLPRRGRLRAAMEKPRHEHDALTRGYAWLITRLLRLRLALAVFVACAIAAIVGIGAWVYPMLASGFMPPMDEGGFVLDYFSKPGTSLEETDRLLRRAESIISATPEVDTYSRRTGLQLGGGLTEAHEGDFFIRLKPLPRREIEEVMGEIRAKIQAQVPDLDIELLQLMEDLIGDLTGVPQPIEIKIASEDPEALVDVATRIKAALEKVPGIVDVNNGLTVSGDAIDVHINPDLAAIDGVDPEIAANTLTQVFTGKIAAQVRREGALPKMLDVRVWTPRSSRQRTEDLALVKVAAKDGHLVPLSRIATITSLTGQPQIVRQNLRRIVAVTARTSGIDLGTAVQRVKAALADRSILTPGRTEAGAAAAPLTYELGGLYEQQRLAFRGLLGVFAAALVLVLLLLVYWFESLRIAIAVLLTSLLALPGVAFGLFITGIELDISSMMGLTMIVGSVTEVSMFMVAALHGRGDAREAIAAAAISRFRPILMTTIAAILAMLPLALGIGEGAALLTPLAVAIISGLIVQIPLVLFLLPQVMVVLGARARNRGGAEDVEGAQREPE